tara:strand:- start:293 stop:1843 length:1551 start_codon:yes stop_codon:yes gene_type:complete
MNIPPINLINANVITLNPDLPKVQDILIKDGKIESINRRMHSAKTINLKGSTLIPGFIDAHYHLSNLGKFLENFNLVGIDSPQKIANLIRENLHKYPKGTWILGRGWDQSLWENGNYPFSKILDEITEDYPISLTRIDGHAIWTNKIARYISGYKENPDIIMGGKIINDCIFIDNAIGSIKKNIPKPSELDVTRYIKNGIKQTVANGITGVHDAWQDSFIVNSIQKLIKKECFPIRCYGMLNGNDKEFLYPKLKSGMVKNDFYTIRAVKAFMDGALGSRGACLFDEYTDDPGNFGLTLLSESEFDKLAKICHQFRFQLCTHAIGDKGNKIVLDTYQKYLNGKNNRRWRIEHAQMVRDEEIPQFVNNDILPSMQPSHCTSDMRWMDKRIGVERCHRISRWKSFINAGLKIPGGSDCPIEKGNPILEFFSAVTRKSPENPTTSSWQSQEKLNRIEALKMLTTWAAYGGFDEKRRGQIKPGFDADLTILSQDLTTCSEEDILKTKVLMTFVNGKIVYKI